MKAVSTSPKINNKPFLKDQGNITPEELYSIIKFDNGRPDHITIALYTDIRSWYKPKKTIKEGNVIYSSKLRGKIYKTSRKALAKKHRVSVETIRLKLIKLENLGLVNRAFTKEKDFYDRDVNNVLNIIVWKETPYFYSEFGLEKTAQNMALRHRITGLTELPPSPNGIGEHISNTNNITVEKKGSTSLSFSTLPPYNHPVKNQNITPTAPQPEPQESVSQTQMSPMSHEGSSPSEPDASHIALQQTRLPELRRKIAKTFGVKTAQELAYETTYTELTADKIAVRLGSGVKLTEYDRECLRDCIKAVYGENVQIVTNKPKQASKPAEPLVNTGFDTAVAKKPQTKRKFQEKSKNEDPMTIALAIPTEQIAAIIPYIPATPIWDKVRQALVEKHGSDLVNIRLKRLEITEQEGMITFTGPLSNTYLVANNFDTRLQECSELYGVVFKLVGVCQITGTLEERIIKFWPTTSSKN
jgi:hypothetical protein